MNKKDVIRAWKDPVYRASLSPEELAQLPAHPAGVIELGDAQLEARVSGGITTAPLCTNYTYGGLKYCCPPATTV